MIVFAGFNPVHFCRHLIINLLVSSFRFCPFIRNHFSYLSSIFVGIITLYVDMFFFYICPFFVIFWRFVYRLFSHYLLCHALILFVIHVLLVHRRTFLYVFGLFL